MATSPSEFISFHQSPIVFRKTMPEEGDLVAGYTPELVGFKNQMSITGVPGCLLGIPNNGNNMCLFDKGSLKAVIVDGSKIFNKDFKIYIPKGTRMFNLTVTIDDVKRIEDIQMSWVMKMGKPPTKTKPMTVAEIGGSYSYTPESAFKKLLAGEEVAITGRDTHIYKVITETGKNFPGIIQKGGWLYVRFLTLREVYGMKATYIVDPAMYKEGFEEMVFEANGDPSSALVDYDSGDIDLPSITGPPLKGIRGEKTGDLSYTIHAEPPGAYLPSAIVTPGGHETVISIGYSHVSYAINPPMFDFMDEGNEFTFTAGNNLLRERFIRVDSGPPGGG